MRLMNIVTFAAAVVGSLTTVFANDPPVEPPLCGQVVYTQKYSCSDLIPGGKPTGETCLGTGLCNAQHQCVSNDPNDHSIPFHREIGEFYDEKYPTIVTDAGPKKEVSSSAHSCIETYHCEPACEYSSGLRKYICKATPASLALQLEIFEYEEQGPCPPQAPEE